MQTGSSSSHSDGPSSKGAPLDLKDLSPELREKALACKTRDELIELAKSAGVELTEEQLDAVAGGIRWGECEEESCRYFFW